MKTPLIRRTGADRRRPERGVTMVLVAVAMIAIIAMAALSIDVITLYLAKQEAQRSADAAALAAAKVISLSGITGDPQNVTGRWGIICGPDDGSNGIATRTAKAVANQNLIAGGPATSPTVTYSSGSTSTSDCTGLSATGFGVNPIVKVELRRNGLPTFFSRIWGNSGNNISATATAEVFNPSNSANSGNQVTGTPIPVQPRCVKPWVVPNKDPLHLSTGGGGTCTDGPTGNCAKIVNPPDGAIVSQGISLNGVSSGGIIGESFWLQANCQNGFSTCNMLTTTTQANYTPSPHSPNLLYVPGQVGGTPVIAVPSCTGGDEFEMAIEGCDQPMNYTCGVPPADGGQNAVDLSRHPAGATANGVACLIHQIPGSDFSEPNGQDYFNVFAAPSSYPFQIFAGTSSPLLNSGLIAGTPISVSPSIVSLPIYDESTPISSGTTSPVTFVGFLQVFINSVDQVGNVYVTVLNVSGCGVGSSAAPVIANSPVPVRLISPP